EILPKTQRVKKGVIADLFQELVHLFWQTGPPHAIFLIADWHLGGKTTIGDPLSLIYAPAPALTVEAESELAISDIAQPCSGCRRVPGSFIRRRCWFKRPRLNLRLCLLRGRIRAVAKIELYAGAGFFAAGPTLGRRVA